MNKKLIIFVVQTIFLILISFPACLYIASASEQGLPHGQYINIINTIAFISVIPNFLLLLLTGISIFAFPIIAPIINGLIYSFLITGTVRIAKTIIKKTSTANN